MRSLIQDERPAIRITLAQLCRDTRRSLGRTQQQLADAIGVTRTHVSAIERGVANPTMDVVERLLRALGLEVDLSVRSPNIIGDRRIRDTVHARCSAYVQRRLAAAGWSVEREVEIVHARSHGWIDVLAFDARTGTLLVIEIKTRLDDLGAIERQLGWYTRSASDIARRFDWRPRRVIPWLLVLASDESDARLRRDTELIRQAFPVRAGAMLAVATDSSAAWPGNRGIALIDPRSRRQAWLQRSRIDGRRSPLPYRDYAHAASGLWIPS
jgi:transcriptional regulator with XRE-family HTH domain